MEQSIINLTFHGIGAPERKIDPGEERYWLTERHFQRCLEEVASREGRGRAVQITFDDGNSSDETIALPVLRHFGLSARFFVLADRVGDPGFLSEKQIYRLRDAGMTIGTHGMRHPRWPDCSDDELSAEIDDSLRKLKALLGHDVAEAAIPFGMYDRRVIRHLRRRASIKTVFTSDGGYARREAWLQPRTTIRTDTPHEALSDLLAGRRPIWTRAVDKLRVARKRYVV